MKQQRRLILKQLGFIFLLILQAKLIHAQDHDADEKEPYDWYNTETYLVTRGDQTAFLFSPFQELATTGTTTYWILANYYEKTFEVDEPSSTYRYHFQLVGPGQQLDVYVGDGWMEYDGKIAFMNPEHFEALTKDIDTHLNAGESAAQDSVDRYIKQQLARPRKEAPSTSLSVADTIAQIAPEAIAELQPLTAQKNSEWPWDEIDNNDATDFTPHRKMGALTQAIKQGSSSSLSSLDQKAVREIQIDTLPQRVIPEKPEESDKTFLDDTPDPQKKEEPEKSNSWAFIFILLALLAILFHLASPQVSRLKKT